MLEYGFIKMNCWITWYLTSFHFWPTVSEYKFIFCAVFSKNGNNLLSKMQFTCTWLKFSELDKYLMLRDFFLSLQVIINWVFNNRSFDATDRYPNFFFYFFLEGERGERKSRIPVCSMVYWCLNDLYDRAICVGLLPVMILPMIQFGI